MKRVCLYSCLVFAGMALSLPASFGAEQGKSAGTKGEKAAPAGKEKPSDREAAKKTTENKAKSYTDRELREATMNAVIVLVGQITKALSEVNDKKSAEDCIAKLEIISKVKDKIQAHAASLETPDMETSKVIMDEFGPLLQQTITNLTKEVTRIQKARYYNSLEFRTALENLLKAPASGMPII